MSISNEEIKTVSYSAYSTFKTCPYKWKLTYIDKKRIKDENLNAIFGDAIHETLQKYIELLYGESANLADSFDLYAYFKTCMHTHLKERASESFKYTKEELFEFIFDGKSILDYFQIHANRTRFFPSKVYTIMGIEYEMLYPLKDALSFRGYYDVVLINKLNSSIKIIDFKTSTCGWNKYQKASNDKLYQLLLYKKFLSDKLNISLDKIAVEFVILKRKLTEYSGKNKIEKFTPANGKVSINNAYSEFMEFVNYCYASNGSYNTDVVYKKTPHSGKQKYSNCKYCKYHEHDLCDRTETKT